MLTESQIETLMQALEVMVQYSSRMTVGEKYKCVRAIDVLEDLLGDAQPLHPTDYDTTPLVDKIHH